MINCRCNCLFTIKLKSQYFIDIVRRPKEAFKFKLLNQGDTHRNMNTSWRLLKFIVQVELLFVQVLGVWPYHFDRKLQCFFTTKVLRCYTAVVVPFILFAYIFTIKTLSLNREEANVLIPNFIGRFTTIMISVQLIVVYGVTIINQIVNYNSINEWLEKAKMIMERIHLLKEGIELPFLWPVVHFIVNVLLINALIIYASVGILSNLIDGSVTSKYWLITFFILPNVTVTVVPNIFYGFMLAITYHYRLLNHRLRNIMHELYNCNKPTISATTGDRQNYFFMKQSCHLSDEIDQLATLHEELTACTRTINRIFSVQLLFYMAYEMCIFISKLFIIYVFVEYELRRLRSVKFNFYVLWYNLVVFMVSFWTTSVLSHSCHSTMEEVCFTMKFLACLIYFSAVRENRNISAVHFAK